MIGKLYPTPSGRYDKIPDHSGNVIRGHLKRDELFELASSRLTRLRDAYMRVEDASSETVGTEFLSLIEVLNALASWDKSEHSTGAGRILEFQAVLKFAFELGMKEAAKVKV